MYFKKNCVFQNLKHFTSVNVEDLTFTLCGISRYNLLFLQIHEVQTEGAWHTSEAILSFC